MLCTNLVVRTPKDGRGISQKQVLEQNLSSTDVHGRTSVERYTDVQLLNSLFQKAYGKVLQYMPLLKILNVSPALRSNVRLKRWLGNLFISTLQDIEPY